MLGYLQLAAQAGTRSTAPSSVDLLVRDLKAQAPDHIAVTGDLVNIALAAEFAQARAWLQALGSPHDVTLVPGNHDAYVRPALAAQAAHWHEFMRDDGGELRAICAFRSCADAGRSR